MVPLLSDCEAVWRLHVVPILPAERVDSPLLEALLAFRQSLVLADSHDCELIDREYSHRPSA